MWLKNAINDRPNYLPPNTLKPDQTAMVASKTGVTILPVENETCDYRDMPKMNKSNGRRLMLVV